SRARLLAVEQLVVEVLGARIEDARAQEIDRAVDEIALLAVQEVERARLTFAQGSERIGAGGSCHRLLSSTVGLHFARWTARFTKRIPTRSQCALWASPPPERGSSRWWRRSAPSSKRSACVGSRRASICRPSGACRSAPSPSPSPSTWRGRIWRSCTS